MSKRVTSGSSGISQVSTRSVKDIDIFNIKNEKPSLSINTNPSLVTIQPKEINPITKSNEYPIRQTSDEDDLIEKPSTPSSNNTSDSQNTNVDSESLDIKKVLKYVTIPGLMLGFFVTIIGIIVGVIGAFGGLLFIFVP
jgi:hypothetical protein